MKLRIGALMVGALAVAALLIPATAGAELHSPSKEIVVVEPRDLPEMAQLPGESLFLHPDNQGSTYLYVEQQQGTRLSVFDVTDPAHIRLSSTTRLQTAGVFDFAGAVTGRTELLRFRDGSHTAMLDLRRANHPRIQAVDDLADMELARTLGTDGILARTAAPINTPPQSSTFKVLDVSAPLAPLLLATVKDVEHTIVNQETGTTYLLGKNGLTVIRQLSAEYEHQVHEMQMQGN